MQPLIQLPPWLFLFKETEDTVSALLRYWGNIVSELDYMTGNVTWLTLSNGVHYEIGYDKVIKIEVYDEESGEIIKYGWGMKTVEKPTYLITFKRTKTSE